MSVKEEKICRLCLTFPKDEVEEIDVVMRQIFDVLLLKLDLDIRHPFVCNDCIEVAIKCLNFKYTCIRTEQIILFSYPTNRENEKYSIKVIYNEREHLAAFVDEDLDICRFCLKRLKRKEFFSLGGLMTEPVFEMLLKYMPELDFNIIDNPIICTTCKEVSEGYCTFILKCLDTEEKIKEYCGAKGTTNVNSKDALQFTYEYPQMCPIKEELNKFEDSDYVYPESIQVEELGIKEEFNLEKNSYKNLSELQSYVPEISMYKCSLCTYEVKQKRQLAKHMRGHKDVLETIMYKCPLCAYETNRKRNVKIHMVVHKDISEVRMYKCSLCAYEGKQKSYLRRHMLLHKEFSERKMYKCGLCAYEGKQKRLLERHMLVHKDVSQTEMYKCSSCAYETKRKNDLKRHMIVHKDVSNGRVYKCSLCAYENEQKSFFQKHMLEHKDFSENMYKCTLCDYKTKKTSNLRAHMLVHKDGSEIRKYRCPSCAYEAKTNSNLKVHMIVHKDVSEIKMHKCSFCAYEAKLKGSLNTHMLVHKDVSEIKMYKCLLCAYEAKQKGSVKRHMLIHKDVSEIKM